MWAVDAGGGDRRGVGGSDLSREELMPSAAMDG
jgi:hypothetical protein